MPTDQQLQLALAKMLPDLLEPKFILIAVGTKANDGYWVVWWKGRTTAILKTEWLHVCWLIEQSLTTDEHTLFMINIWNITCDEESNAEWDRKQASASWQQRAQAICKVKGVEV